MVTVDDILEYIDNLSDATSDTPFEGDFFSRVFRRKSNAKWFGVILRASVNYFLRYLDEQPADNVVLNLKCPPDLGEFIRSKYPQDVLPAYHMNKAHWISVILSSDAEKSDIERLIDISYELAGGKSRKKTQEKK